MAENLTYTIILSNGTALAGLELNGSNYISKDPIDKGVFALNTSPVTIETVDARGEVVAEEEHSHMELVRFDKTVPGEIWFALRDLDDQELFQLKIQSDIEYIAMMTDVEL